MNRLTDSDYRELTEICRGAVFRDVDLARISRWRTGGKADVILQPGSGAQVAELRRWFHERGKRHVVIGLTSNLLFADEGLHVPCIQIGPRMSHVVLRDQDVIAQAGAWVPGLARRIMQGDLTGAEHICGIPGTLGGLISMNGGSQREGIGTAVKHVVGVDEAGVKVKFDHASCDFSYRASVFQGNGVAITACCLCFQRTFDRRFVRRKMLEILRDRRLKFPPKEPNCGSVFKSDPAMYGEIGPPGTAIERLGLKGCGIGGAQVSSRHANFIVNTGGAKAIDILNLIWRVSDAVHDATGYRMEVEVKFVRSDGAIQPGDSLGLRDV